ncbi:MAG: response regulator [Desulfatibacillaceae bacterium]|nr:response regulator [Desulfatibacillaceae bacterium]
MAQEQWNILLADDEPDIRDVMSLALEDAGYMVHAAEDGEQALEICGSHDIRIVITDIRMPGMDGIRLLEKVKAAFADIEVIVMTAFGEMDLAIQALRLDASDFINKPVNNDALFMAINRAKNRYESRKKLKDHAALLERENALTALELTKSLDYQRSLIQSSMDGILGCDETGCVALVNKSLEKMLGFSREEMIGQPALEMLFTPQDAKKFEEDMASQKYGGPGRLFIYETQILQKSGKNLPVQVSAIDLPGGGIVCFFRDLRQIRRLEREFEDQARILLQDKMLSLGRLAASVVHEINNPLSGVLNYARLMKKMLATGRTGPADLADFEKYLELVESETNRCTQIVGNLLAFSRRSKDEMEPVDVALLVERCVILSQHKLSLSKIALKVDVKKPLPLVSGSFNQLAQCVINLVLNAVDAMPQGGELEIGADYDPASNTVRLKAADTGTGIKPDDLERIFEPFFTTKQQGYGVGLGLSTVYGIMERHKGSVTVESKPGKGAVFTLVLPADKQQASQ